MKGFRGSGLGFQIQDLAEELHKSESLKNLYSLQKKDRTKFMLQEFAFSLDSWVQFNEEQKTKNTYQKSNSRLSAQMDEEYNFMQLWIVGTSKS